MLELMSRFEKIENCSNLCFDRVEFIQKGFLMRSISIFAIVAIVQFSDPAAATSISVDDNGGNFEVFHFRDFRGPNSVGFSEGDRLSFGAVNVVPNAKGENDGVVVSPNPTTGIARQNGQEVELLDISTTINPNQMASAVEYDAALTGSWEFEFTNGTDKLVVNSPEVGSAVGLPIVDGLRIAGDNPLTPTFSWNAPQELDGATVSIYDLNSRNFFGLADRIYVAGINNDETSFTVPNGELEAGGKYAFSISPRLERTTGTNPSGSSQAGSAISLSRTFYEFSASDEPLPPGTFLPQVSISSGTPVFNFDNPVVAGDVEFYDPVVAVGFDYMIGDGNPNFNSFILPEIGDDLFDLLLWNGIEYVFESSINALDEFEFSLGGVDRFRILGIETGAALDPTDPTAFVTGLSFVSDGQFTGTMTPITLDVPAAVPLPAGLSLLLAGLSGLFLFGRR